MDFSWSPEQIELRDATRRFAEGTLNVDLEERLRAGEFRRDLWKACAEFGILAMPVPVADGGSGHDLLTTVLAMEALGHGCRDQGLLFSIHAHLWAVVMPVLTFAEPAVRARVLPGLLDGSLVGAHAMSEPDSGSNSYALRTRAARRRSSRTDPSPTRS
jgi:alkylation response protein AidB-like acyl-CoA dehydrogenase